MSVSFGGFNSKAVTFKTEEEIAQGTPVKMSSNNTVEACADGDEFIGTVSDGDSAYAAVQLYGEVTAKYSGTAPDLGFTALVAGADGVKAGGTKDYLIISVDETAKTVTFLM